MPRFGGLGRNFSRMGVIGGATYNPRTALGSDLIAWWDADPRYWGSKGSITTATGVSSWKDIVAGYDAVQATGASQAAYSATAFNGTPGLTFDGTDDELTCTDAALLAALPAGGTPCELWALASQDLSAADTTVRDAVAYGVNTTTTIRIIGRGVFAGVNRSRVTVGDGLVANAISGAFVDLSTRHVIRGVIGATESIPHVDGSVDRGASVAVVPATAIPTRLRIGARSNNTATSFWVGKIGAVLVTKPLSDAKAAALFAWLLPRRRL